MRPGVEPTTVVVGADGFIGGSVCQALERTGTGVVRIVRRRSGADCAALRRADLVLYTAGTITPALAASEPERIDSDRVALAGVLDECKRGGRRPTLVLLSSGGTVYLPTDPPPYGETSRLGPTGAYGHAKLDQERMLLDAREAVRPVVFRLSNVYGPRQRCRGGLGVVAHWLHAVATGAPVHVYGEMSAKRDYIYIDDVCRALIRVRQIDAADRQAIDGMVLNIGAGRPTSLAELIHIVRSTVDCMPPVVLVPGRSFDRTDNWLDVRRAEAELGWTATVDLPTGVARAWAAMCRAGGAFYASR